MATEAKARAKVNLALHVTGQRADGYHLLDSLVVFADIGDVVRCETADRLSLALTGPFASDLSPGDDNLVLRAARLIGARAAITLEKNLPVASGIGGGSADAAATLRALAELCGLPLPDDVLSLGADVPVCLAGRAARMQGVGEIVTPLPSPLPETWLVLANPGVAVSTPAIFRDLENRQNPAMPATLPRFASAQSLADFLRAQRNDLEPPALRLAPVIGEAKTALAASTGCLIARMSGSGATCFGLFAERAKARHAARRLKSAHPDWWVVAAPMLR